MSTFGSDTLTERRELETEARRGRLDGEEELFLADEWGGGEAEGVMSGGREMSLGTLKVIVICASSHRKAKILGPKDGIMVDHELVKCGHMICITLELDEFYTQSLISSSGS
jgi:hypothetical protein